MKKVLLFVFFVLGIAWILFVASIMLRRNLPMDSQWQLPRDKNARLNTSGINDVQYSPDGTRIAVASTIGVWFYDVNADKAPVPLTTDMTSIFSISFSLDGETLASGGEDELVRLWDVDTRNHKRTFITNHGPFFRVLFSTDGETLASCSVQELNLWDVATNTHKANNRMGASWFTISMNADGGTLATINKGYATIRLWDVITGEEEGWLRGHTKDVESIAFSPDGKTLASGSRDKTVRLWDVATGKQKKVLKGHRKSIDSIVFSADGQMLASASRDKTIRVWDAITGKHKKILKGHTAPVNGAAFSPDGRAIVSWSNDQTIRLWDVHTGEVKKTIKVPIAEGE